MGTKPIVKFCLALTISAAMLLQITAPHMAMADAAQRAKSTLLNDKQSQPTKTISTQGENTRTLKLDNNVASMTKKRTIKARFKLPKGTNIKKIRWTYGGKPLSEWKSYKNGDYNGAPFITVTQIKAENGEVTANINFGLAYGTENLAEPSLQRPLYASLMGTYELAAVVNGKTVARAPMKLVPYDSFRTYDELKPEIDAITAQAAQKNNRYIKTMSIGKSVEGRDIYMTVLAKDKATIDKYQNVTHPDMLNHPAKLENDIKSGAFGDYQVPIWINNIHPNEAPGFDAIINYFKTMALDKNVTYKTTPSNGKSSTVTLNLDDALDHVFFLFLYTENPDGRVHTERSNAEYFDLNRDNSYQTQPETRSITEQIARWSPISFLDLHGFDKNFLIEPTTPPHNPNIEYDLLMDNMVEQAKVMGEAGIANTKYDYYHIPYEEHRKTAENPKYVSKGTASGWDDASPAYTAVFAMHHGAMGHTLETPESNEESTKALYYSVAAATDYVMEKKEKLFLNQLKIYERGINNMDDHAVDRYLVNAKNQVIGRPRHGNKNFFPEYYVLPTDKSLQKNPLEAYRMIEYFIRNGVKVERSTKAVSAAGKTYPAGSFIINMHQATHGIANMVLYDGIDVSDYASVAGEIVQDFPVLRGFECDAIREAGVFAGKTSPVTSVSIPATQMPNHSAYVLIRNTNNDVIKTVNELLKSGKVVTMLSKSGTGYEAGDFAVAYDDLHPLASKYYLDVTAFGNNRPVGKVLKPSTVAALGEPAYVLKNLGFKVTDDQQHADVLVNTFDSDKLVEKGKPYIAYGNMGMDNVKNSIPQFAFAGPTWERYEGVFLANVKQDNVITAPYANEEYFYTVTGSYITKLPKAAKVLATISNKENFFKAGWWPGHDAARGKIMAFTYKENKKNLTVFSNDLTNGAHSQQQFRLLANSIFNAVAGKY
ncbi:M14 family zinc carboxypeptidase [Paenibacillus sp. FSL M7-0802]|uniref:M14 family metallopeptidase n=1 Tax=Paenibacillus sp. FSL M7-0802 TaxID=2921536 RepID=UPI0030F87E13